jgi:hypothetical protein
MDWNLHYRTSECPISSDFEAVSTFVDSQRDEIAQIDFREREPDNRIAISVQSFLKNAGSTFQGK